VAELYGTLRRSVRTLEHAVEKTGGKRLSKSLYGRKAKKGVGGKKGGDSRSLRRVIIKKESEGFHYKDFRC